MSDSPLPPNRLFRPFDSLTVKRWTLVRNEERASDENDQLTEAELDQLVAPGIAA